MKHLYSMNQNSDSKMTPQVHKTDYESPSEPPTILISIAITTGVRSAPERNYIGFNALIPVPKLPCPDMVSQKYPSQSEPNSPARDLWFFLLLIPRVLPAFLVLDS